MTEWGREWTIFSEDSDEFEQAVNLERIGDGENEWGAEGPGGSAVGTMEEAIRGSVAVDVNADWLAAVLDAVSRQVLTREYATPLRVMPAAGVWFHASASRNRASIRRHGLDWTKMTPPGIAGSRAPETDGIFLARSLSTAEWMAGMCREPPVDIWTVTLDTGWLDSAPSGGGGDDMMICRSTIPNAKLRLTHPDLPSRIADRL